MDKFDEIIDDYAEAEELRNMNFLASDFAETVTDEGQQFGLIGNVAVPVFDDTQVEMQPGQQMLTPAPDASPQSDNKSSVGKILGDIGQFIDSPFTGVTQGVARVIGNTAGALGIVDQKDVDRFFKMVDEFDEVSTKDNLGARVLGMGGKITGQYILPVVTGYKTFTSLGANPVVATLMADALTGFFGLSPNDENIFNAIAKDAETPVAQDLRALLATDPDNSEFENRLKNAGEAIALLGGSEALVRAVPKVIKQAKQFVKSEQGQQVTRFVQQMGQDADARLDSAMKGTTLSANPVGAVADVAISTAGKVASRLTDEEVPSLRQVLETKAKEMEVKPAARTQPSGDQMFEVSPVAYQAGVRQADQVETPVPRAPEGAKLPKKQRAALLVENMDRIAEIIADRARPGVGTNVQFFYHLGPLIDKAKQLGIPENTARDQAREFAMLYGATSPRTSTEPNLRSASLVRAKDTAGVNYDEIVGPGGSGINEAGYPMMINPAKPGQAAGMHKILIDQLRETGKIDYRTNPKPATFAENVAGNLNGVTVDTHAIRGALHVLNEIAPGKIPRQWFNSDAAYKAYLDNPSDVANYAGKGLADTLDGQVVDGVKQQTEYAVFSDLYKKVAERLGVMPAEAQSLSWFANGKFTGLASPPKSIVELINDRVDVTAQALGKSKDVIFKAFMEGKIPLLSATGTLVGANLISTPDQSDDAI